MEFDIVLRAKSSDEGGLLASFEAQLAKLGGTATLISEVAPIRVETGDDYYFEAQRTYHVVL